MNEENRAVVEKLRSEIKELQSDKLIKLESERKLEERFGVGRQRIREAINQLVSAGLLVKYEGKGTYIPPVIKNKWLNLLCSPGIKLNDPFYNRMLMELTNYSAKNSVNIIPLTMDTLKNGNIHAPVLLIGKFEDEMLKKIQEEFSQIVSFEDYPEHDEFTQIYFDHFKIGMNAAKVLAGYGHKRAICITGPERYASAKLRKNGFIRGARKYMTESVVLESKMNFSGGYELAEQVGCYIKGRGFTAVFAANDWMAIGLIQALSALKIKIPDQVSVIGVDNIPLASQFAPALTTYSLDANMMITEFFSLMKDDGDDKGINNPKRIILKPVLMMRDSVRKI